MSTITTDVKSYMQLHAAYVELRKLGWVYKDGLWVAPESDPVVSKAAEKMPVKDEGAYAVADGQVHIAEAYIGVAKPDSELVASLQYTVPASVIVDAVLDATKKIDLSALRSDEVLRADIEALKESLESNYALHDKQLETFKKLDKAVTDLSLCFNDQHNCVTRHSVRINALEDAIKYAGSNKGKGRNTQTYRLEEAIRQVTDEVLQNALKPGGLLHKY